MARLFWRKQALMAKVETIYGTDAVPTPEANGMLAYDVSVQPLEGADLERAFLLPHFGSRPTLPTEKHARVAFAVELQGAGAAGDVPKYDPMLRACSLAATVTEATDVQYDPISDSDTQEGSSLYWNADGNRHIVKGWRGDVTLVLEKQKYPMLRFDGLGLYSTPGASALVNPDLSGWIAPLVISKAHTTFSLFGAPRLLERLEIKLGNQVEGRFLVNAEEILITDRKATMTAVIEAQPYGTFNPFTSAEGGATGGLALAHGAEAGKIVQVGAPVVQIGRPTFSESQGVKMWTLPGRLLPDEGDDEFKLTIK